MVEGDRPLLVLSQMGRMIHSWGVAASTQGKRKEGVGLLYPKPHEASRTSAGDTCLARTPA